MHAYTVGVVHLADIKFGNLEQTQSSEIVEHLVWLNNQGLPIYFHSTRLSMVLAVTLVWRLKKISRSPN